MTLPIEGAAQNAAHISDNPDDAFRVLEETAMRQNIVNGIHGPSTYMGEMPYPVQEPLITQPKIDTTELLKAQGKFIHEQLLFMNHGDLAAYSKAQSEFIMEQNRALNQLGLI